MKSRVLLLAGCALAAGAAFAVEVAVESYNAGELKIVVKGTGTATLTARADYTYLSAKTGVEGIARAESQSLKVPLTAEGVPVTINFVEPEGSVTTVEITVFVNGKEMVRETYSP